MARAILSHEEVRKLTALCATGSRGLPREVLARIRELKRIGRRLAASHERLRSQYAALSLLELEREDD